MLTENRFTAAANLARKLEGPDEALGQSLKKILESDRAQGTIIGYGRILKLFDTFCQSRRDKNLSQNQLRTLFLLKKFSEGPSSSVQTATAALNYFLGEVQPHEASLQKAIASAASRTKPTVQNRTKLPLEHYRRLVETASKYPELDRAGTLAILLFNAMLRISEALALRWDDVQLDKPDGEGSLQIRRSKTDQEGKGVNLPIKLEKEEFRVVTRFKLVNGAGFIFLSASTKTPITYSTACKELKLLLHKAGLENFNYTSHAFRGGAATAALESGVDGTEVMRAGRWKSTSAFGCYIARKPIKKSTDGEHANLGDEDGPRKN
ncbi:unnamed protein product [Caenorhabditis auriculariae]|uniref:Tyr recombinase domain-containing protein n=1 Tax=Caenorhabditis auriculariae TaxID=2777116 RepID=A0A8S1GT99_9PELO|nr:unnamed protein product [Caenorhabditis auriculariae]